MENLPVSRLIDRAHELKQEFLPTERIPIREWGRGVCTADGSPDQHSTSTYWYLVCVAVIVSWSQCRCTSSCCTLQFHILHSGIRIAVCLQWGSDVQRGRGVLNTGSHHVTKQSYDHSENKMTARYLATAAFLVAVVFCSFTSVAQPLSIPREFDWRTKGVVPPVKNQGEIGEAVVIAAVSAVESYYAIESGKLVQLSEAEAADCCSTGFIDYIFMCFARIGGLCSEASYPKRRGACYSKSCTPVAKVTGEVKVQSGNETALQIAVLKRPVLVGVDASHVSFQMYVGGVYSEPSCSSVVLDHAMLVVGYGTTAGVDYWICQNSWGEIIW